ncbi:outer membrane lipoprotein-sorting protein [Vibrio mangrovi]|uniref:Outer membrane lipoprotein-sorting protein n=1 Tax=Vibrio mangrovi TaxID=474394 RepID=A0A1Y6IMJ1_9VIBR|nr:outer membrane lipoprotein-sorting protein [Vibrio mangrovi]MDW6004322.1 outer membrane lipoprotein-sorting protein [Vibrio mangrovi]SMR98879.1 hypothetical protein VIM7927_00092 [Vibrio mangrovi]
MNDSIRKFNPGKTFCSCLILLSSMSSFYTLAAEIDPTALLHASFDNWRGKSSETVIQMTVHRPDWERSLTMKTWTVGNEKTLARFTAPVKDAGNATLKLDKKTFIYNPKLNQIIKLPASMLSQSWMGSDFSYNDLAKADDILTQYTHKTLSAETQGQHRIYKIEAQPKPGAPVVWGKLEVKIREDGILMGETYFDQDMQPVREMRTELVSQVGDRPYPTVTVMYPKDKPDHWTRIKTTEAQFNMEIPGYIFTRSNLQNPRER